jgi:hypothetical protein
MKQQSIKLTNEQRKFFRLLYLKYFVFNIKYDKNTYMTKLNRNSFY